MPPRRVPRTILNPEVEEEQPILPQQGEIGLPPPQQPLDNVAIDAPDVPLASPLEAAAQHESDAEGPVTRAEFCALNK
ncbi:hypothetical protein ACLOJK_035042, partial [Asimina triloba]